LIALLAMVALSDGTFAGAILTAMEILFGPLALVGGLLGRCADRVVADV